MHARLPRSLDRLLLCLKPLIEGICVYAAALRATCVLIDDNARILLLRAVSRLVHLDFRRCRLLFGVATYFYLMSFLTHVSCRV